MKKIFRYISWKNLEREVTGVVQRFPLTVVALLSMTCILLWLIAQPEVLDRDIVNKLLMTLTLTVWVSLTWQLVYESLDTQKVKREYGWVAILLIAGIYWLTLPQEFSGVYGDFFITHLMIHFALILSLVFGLGVGPWWFGRYQDSRFYNLVVSEGMYLIQTLVVGLIVLLAGLATIATIDVLFEPRWLDEEVYLYWVVISWVLIAPIFFLARFPSVMPEKLGLAEKFLHFIVTYIALPFICLYFLILYAYTLKVIFNFSDWPEGVVAWLVIWFSVFGYGTYILSYHLRTSSWVERIRSWTPILLLPQIAMLFYAIGLRINQHGWTVNRYLVVAFGLWLLFLSIYFIWQNKRSQLLIIPASLFVAVVLILVGPWGMFSVSERSQVQKLEYLLSFEEMTGQQEKHAASAIEYLCQFHGCHTVYTVPALAEEVEEHHEYPWEIINHLGLTVHDSRYPPRGYYDDTDGAWEIAGFSTLLLFDSWSERGTRYDREKDILRVNGEELSIASQVLDLRNSLSGDTSFTTKKIQKSRNVFDLVSGQTRYRIFITSFAVEEEQIVSIEGAVAY